MKHRENMSLKSKEMAHICLNELIPNKNDAKMGEWIKMNENDACKLCLIQVQV